MVIYFLLFLFPNSLNIFPENHHIHVAHTIRQVWPTSAKTYAVLKHNVGSMLEKRFRRWSSIKPSLGSVLVWIFPVYTDEEPCHIWPLSWSRLHAMSIRKPGSRETNACYTLQSQKAVPAYLKSKQILHVGFARQTAHRLKVENGRTEKQSFVEVYSAIKSIFLNDENDISQNTQKLIWLVPIKIYVTVQVYHSY